MAFAVPTPVFSKGRRHYTDFHNIVALDAKDKFKPRNDLFCSKCIKAGLITEAYGFCKVCRDFMCSKCVDKHESTLLTLNHGIIVGNEMMARYQNAMRKDKKAGHSVSRNHLDMVADGRASFQYEDKGEKMRSVSPSQDADLLTEPKIRVGTDMRKCFICACVVYSDGKVVLADANNKTLKLFNKHFNCLFVFHMKEEPWDACKAINYDQDLFVTENRAHGVHQFKVGKDLQYVLTVKLDGECFGVTNWKGGVAVSVKKDKTFTIKLLDQFGNTHRNIENGYQGQLKMTSPWYLTSVKRGRHLIISDAGSGTITSIDVDGGINFVYKDRKELRDPRNICSDGNDNIYVIEYETDTVHKLTPTGQDHGVILCRKDGLENPCGIAYHDSMLYIQAKMDSNYLRVYDLM